MLYADSGWNFMEGENIGHNPPSLAASASYHIGDFDLRSICIIRLWLIRNPIQQKSSTPCSVSRFVVMTIREVICSVSVLPGISIGERNTVRYSGISTMRSAKRVS